ncbi:unnamed protein product [Closterium sp. Yama58-4]|nr:unnamed protein product [Closterium sp. Yama58-4]
MALDRKADTALTGGRHEARARYDVGCDGTGHVLALRVRAVLNGTAAPAPPAGSLLTMGPLWRSTAGGRWRSTSGWSGRTYQHAAHYTERAAAVEAFNAAHVWRKRGVAMAPALYHVPLLAKPACMTVFGDGSVVVEAGGVEMGQGLSTKLRQAAALGLNALCLSMGHAGMTAASSTSEACCAAVLLACHHLLPALLTAKAAAEQAKACRRVKRDSGLIEGESGIGEDDVAVEEGDVASWEEVAAQAKAMELTLSAQAHFTPDPSHASYFTFGAAVSEVEVYVLTGAVAVLRCDIHYDCARSLNPAVDIGQVEGAFVQGQGFFTTEEVLVDEATGKLLSAQRLPRARHWQQARRALLQM